ncbi:MAG: nitrate/nitrite transporter NrtS [Pseudomonadota bacterium]
MRHASSAEAAHTMDRSQEVLRRVFGRPVMLRSLMVGIVVGTILNAINQGDALLAGATINWFKVALTYCVPFCVATYGAWSALRLLQVPTRSATERRVRA